MADSWRVLVVDDELDVHAVTEIALKRLTWKERPISLTSVFSAEEAREKLVNPDTEPFNVALVDVMMESDDAGLRLCEFIRENTTPFTRIVLRTGQPGMAPELSVLADYDIDYYLAKSDATAERLFSVIRACLRSSEDIRQLQS